MNRDRDLKTFHLLAQNPIIAPPHRLCLIGVSHCNIKSILQTKIKKISVLSNISHCAVLGTDHEAEYAKASICFTFLVGPGFLLVQQAEQCRFPVIL